MVRRTRDGQTFGDVYRQQYRSTRSVWSLAAVCLLLFVVAAVSHPRDAGFMIVLAVAALLVLVTALVFRRGRRARRDRP